MFMWSIKYVNFVAISSIVFEIQEAEIGVILVRVNNTLGVLLLCGRERMHTLGVRAFFLGCTTHDRVSGYVYDMLRHTQQQIDKHTCHCSSPLVI